MSDEPGGLLVVAGSAVVIMLILALAGRARSMATEGQITLPDQRTCGTARAEHVWVSRGTRLVVCETPSGLVVREVGP